MFWGIMNNLHKCMGNKELELEYVIFLDVFISLNSSCHLVVKWYVHRVCLSLGPVSGKQYHVSNLLCKRGIFIWISLSFLMELGRIATAYEMTMSLNDVKCKTCYFESCNMWINRWWIDYVSITLSRPMNWNLYQMANIFIHFQLHFPSIKIVWISILNWLRFVAKGPTGVARLTKRNYLNPCWSRSVTPYVFNRLDWLDWWISFRSIHY